MWRFLARYWRDFSITTKFIAAFAALLSLIVAVAFTGYVALTVVRNQTEAAIVTSMEIQRLVLKMDAKLQHARLLERDFFLRWPIVGFAEARDVFVDRHHQQIEELVGISANLKALIAQSDVGEGLRDSNANLGFYLAATEVYATTFDEAVELVAQVGATGNGVQVQLAQASASLLTLIELPENPRLLLLYRELQSSEKDYLLTRNSVSMRAALDVLDRLRQDIVDSTEVDADQKAQAFTYLDDYTVLANKLLKLDVSIRALLDQFELLARAIDPYSTELIRLSSEEVQRAREKIARTSRLAVTLLLLAVVGAVAIAALVALLLNKSVTRHVLELTEAAEELQRGKLDTLATVHGADELGRLAESFNAMAVRIKTLVSDLQGRAEAAQARLFQAIESMSEGFALYDSDDRFVLANDKYLQMLPGMDDKLVPGVAFENLMRDAVDRGLFADALDGTGHWVEERIAHHRNPSAPFEVRMSDGRWLRVSEYKTPEGEFVGIETDITDQKHAEEALRRQNEYLAALHATTLGVINRLQLGDLLEALITRAGQLLGTSHGYIYLLDSSETEMIRKVGVGVFSEHASTRVKRGEGIAGRAWEAGEPIVVNDYDQSRDRSEGNPQDMDVGAIIGVPLKSGDDVIGVLGMAYDVASKRTFDQPKVELLSRFGELASMSLDNARLYAAARDAQRQAELALQQLKQAQESLVHAEKMASLGQLTVGIAHEIKNPLNFVNNFAEVSNELLEELRQALASTVTALDEEQLEDASELFETLSGNLLRIKQHGDRADSIVKSMLAHAREGPSTPRSTDLNALIEESLNLAYHAARAEDQSFNVSMERQFDTNVGQVEVYPQDISRVFLNLISNGFYATRKRQTQWQEPGYEPTLTVTTRDLGNEVQVRVKDNGTGIPEAAVARIFDPFFTTKPTGEGTGLGLSLSYETAVNQHHGQLEVDTMEGEHTEFVLTLPRTLPEARAAEGAA